MGKGMTPIRAIILFVFLLFVFLGHPILTFLNIDFDFSWMPFIVTGGYIFLRLFSILGPRAERNSKRKAYINSPKILFSSGRANYLSANTHAKKKQALELIREAAFLGSIDAKQFLRNIEGHDILEETQQVVYASPEIR